MLEYGLTSKIGRTLERSACSVLSFSPEDIEQIAAAVQLRVVNELGIMSREDRIIFQRMVIGWLNLLRCNGAFKDVVFDEYTINDGKSYMLSNDRNRWLPGQQSGRNIPRFIAEYLGKSQRISIPYFCSYSTDLNISVFQKSLCLLDAKIHKIFLSLIYHLRAVTQTGLLSAAQNQFLTSSISVLSAS